MLWDLIVLVIFGAIVGWIASILVGRSSKMGCGANVVVGILGAIIGGFVVRFFGEVPIEIAQRETTLSNLTNVSVCSTLQRKLD